MLFFALHALYFAKASGDPSRHEPSAAIGIPADTAHCFAILCCEVERFAPLESTNWAQAIEGATRITAIRIAENDLVISHPMIVIKID
jgi:hypothetical protein